MIKKFTSKTTTRGSKTTFALSLFAGLSVVAGAPLLAQDAEEAPPLETEVEAEKEMTKGEKELAKLLEGRVAGEPQNCIRSLPSQRSRTIDRTAYVFGSGETIYVQRTTNPERINDRETLVIRRFGGGSQLCRQESMRTVDPVTRIFGGGVIFVDFVPYIRVKDEEAETSES
ncbi:MAG: hypothetical protein AAFQ13_02460 [Pseudomonadota bacterium]